MKGFMTTIKIFFGKHAVILISFSALIVAIFFLPVYEDFSVYWEGLGIEAAGVVWEIILIVGLIGFYDKHRMKKDKIDALKRRIDDFKKLKSEYGYVIIGSSLRQLAELGVTDINFTGIELEKFSFNYDHGIQSIRKSVFTEGFRLDQPRHWGSRLTEVDFSEVDCREVVFGRGWLSATEINDCDFNNANLTDAKFIGIHLTCAEDRILRDERDWHEIVDEADDDVPIYAQTYRPMFSEADLKGCDFNQARLENIDFRDATNILEANFYGTKGLDTCEFDENIREQLKKTPPTNKNPFQ